MMTRIYNIAVLIAVLLVYCGVICAQTPAFPGAEGFGRYAVGGRGGKVITVTSLDDYTSAETPIEGTLRWALGQYVSQETIDGKTVTVYEPLTIVFNVAGNIVLKEDLKVKRDYLTIAGQTAPGDGICICGHSMTFNGATGGEMWHWGPRRHDVIIRYLRFRPVPPPSADNKYALYGTDIENYENVILDHCTMTWANEECLAIYDTKNTTVQWCIAAEGLYSANHPKGNRSYCGVWGGQFASYHHNLIAHNDSRNIRFNGARAHDTVAVVEFRNNVVYNWGSNNSGYGLETEIQVEGVTRNELNMFCNYYKHGPASGYNNKAAGPTNKVNRLVRIDQTKESVDAGFAGRHYIADNYLSNYPDVTADNWWCGVQFNNYKDTALAKSIFRSADYSPEVQAILPAETETAEEAFLSVLSGAGACAPRRDWQDARIVEETRTGTASGKRTRQADGIINHPSAVGGWPLLQGEPYTDTDLDGIPDSWETEHGLDPEDATDGAKITESGYSNLELYINSIPQDFSPMNPIADETLIPQEAAVEDIIIHDQDGKLLMRDGIILLQKDGKTYTFRGEEVSATH
ncbi:MAG: pectate lyase [Paludibacteraceae bacterium]|nr:pectate lyase [Paludibacteraceae bacterium]